MPRDLSKSRSPSSSPSRRRSRSPVRHWDSSRSTRDRSRSPGKSTEEQATTEPHRTHLSSSALSRLPHLILPGYDHPRPYVIITKAKLDDMQNSLKARLKFLQNRFRDMEDKKLEPNESTGEADNKEKTVANASVDGAE